jgi:hypothetical protein
MALSIDEIQAHYERYRQVNNDRDQRMSMVLQVRQGKMRDVYPDLFPDGPFENPIVANIRGYSTPAIFLLYININGI